MAYIKLKVDEATALEIQSFYEAQSYPNKANPYLVFQAATPDKVMVTGYKSKDLFTIIFQGPRAKILEEAYIFDDDPQVIEDTPSGEKSKTGFEDLGEQMGSDEVGVGDLFGPLVVASCYLRSDDIKKINDLKILDSKKMTDSYILEIGEILGKEFLSFVAIASPKKVSTMHDQGWNMHKIMANLHNHTHIELKKKIKTTRHLVLYIDQFVSESLYRKYLITPPPEEAMTLHFKTKGESYYPSVAAASVLARYHFLKEWVKMEQALGVSIPKGANLEVDRMMQTLYNSPKKDLATSYVKTFFRNYQELL